MKVAIVVLLFFGVFCGVANAFKVLAFLPFDSYSHFLVGYGMGKALINAGHEVTFVSPYPQENLPKNSTQITTEDFLNFMDEKNKNLKFYYFESNLSIAPLLEIFALHWAGGDLVDFYMKHPKIAKLLKSNEKFDVCVVESLTFDALNLGIAEHFGCTLVTFVNYAAVKLVDDATGNLSPPSFVPKAYLSYTDKMSFKERFSNNLYTLIEDFIHEFFVKWNQRRLYRKHFPSAKKSFDEMLKSSSIIFMNTHIASSTPRPNMPNVIDIGGIHIQPKSSLPNDIKNFIDSANDGVILFSMGAVLKSSQFPLEKREALLKAFGKLKQKIIWNFDTPSIENLPSNVMLKANLTKYQRDILAHPNAKIFITHGGLVGISEALAQGIPLLFLPIFGHDQKLNKARAIEKEYGVHVSYSDISEESITQAINELLSNNKYRENAKIIADRYNDRPMTPQESVVYWTEFAVRHQGAEHLRSEAAQNLNYFQLRSWDVYLIIYCVIAFILYIDFLILRGIWRRIFGKTKTRKEKRH